MFSVRLRRRGLHRILFSLFKRCCLFLVLSPLSERGDDCTSSFLETRRQRISKGQIICYETVSSKNRLLIGTFPRYLFKQNQKSKGGYLSTMKVSIETLVRHWNQLRPTFLSIELVEGFCFFLRFLYFD